jgi:hypothetical protein
VTPGHRRRPDPGGSKRGHQPGQPYDRDEESPEYPTDTTPPEERE